MYAVAYQQTVPLRRLTPARIALERNESALKSLPDVAFSCIRLLLDQGLDLILELTDALCRFGLPRPYLLPGIGEFLVI